MTPERSKRLRVWRALSMMLFFMTLCVVLVGRMHPPSDLLQSADQSKTAAFTADVALHG